MNRVLLGLAAVAVAFAAADTYVVVLALPDMMEAAGLSGEELQRAAPIVSGFLLGYVAMLPLIGRIADLRGRVPVLAASLVVFAAGSLVTAAAYDLPSLVAGRFLQGVGGWRDIFWINLAVGLVLAAGVLAVRRRSPGPPGRERGVTRPLLAVVVVLFLAALLLVMRQPSSLVTSVSLGGPFVPFGDATSRWWSPLGLVAIALGVVVLALLARALWPTLRVADVPGSALLAVALGGVILAFATAEPEKAVLSPAGPVCLLVSAAAAVGFVVQQRRARSPLVPPGALRARPAWGALVVSFLVGAALIAALVDIPVFARVTVYGDSQLKAALVLVEFLVALPVGALAGGAVVRHLRPAVVTAAGMALAVVAFVLMSRWHVEALHHVGSSVVLVVAGLGFGLAIAPVNAALLAATEASVHGVTSALLVVARMVGMLVGISALTTIGLRRYYAVSADFPSPSEVCHGKTRCDAYSDLLQGAGVAQLHAIFVGAALCALLAGLAALALLRDSRAGDVPHVTAYDGPTGLPSAP